MRNKNQFISGIVYLFPSGEIDANEYFMGWVQLRCNGEVELRQESLGTALRRLGFLHGVCTGIKTVKVDSFLVAIFIRICIACAKMPIR